MFVCLLHVFEELLQLSCFLFVCFLLLFFLFFFFFVCLFVCCCCFFVVVFFWFVFCCFFFFFFFFSISVSLSPALSTGMRHVSSRLLVLRTLNPYITDIINIFYFDRN